MFKIRINLILLISISITFSNLVYSQPVETPVQMVAAAKSHANNMSADNIQATLKTLFDKYKSNHQGKVADYIPELGKVNANYFGIAIVTVDGKIFTYGESEIPFSIQSISKLFAYALALKDNGEKAIADKIGVNATGQPFNSVMAIELMPHHLQNPLVNAGAIQITSAIQGKDSAEKWQRVLTFLQQLSDGKPTLGTKVYQSEMATNKRNRAISELLSAYNLMYSDGLDAVDRYTKACSVMVNAKQLALMGATLANDGIHPVTHQSLIPPEYVQDVLSQMVTNGLYENSGLWWQSVGLPAKSGVGGGFLAVVPHQFAIAVFSPPLDAAGNSVRAQAVISDLSKLWHLHLLSPLMLR